MGPLFAIMLAVTTCHANKPDDCRTDRLQTDFISVTQCQIMGQIALSRWLMEHPNRKLTKYECLHITGKEA